MSRVLAAVAAAILLFAGAVWYSQAPLPAEESYSGLQFAEMSRAAARRAGVQGALVAAVDTDSPADKAGIAPGEVVSAIDGMPVATASEASGKIRRLRIGQNAVLTLHDITQGEAKPQQVAVTLAAMPDPRQTGKYSVYPPPVLARELFAPPPIVANAAWARQLSRGAFLKPLELFGLGAGRCNALAPEKWRIAGYAADGSLLHVMAPATFQHAILVAAPLAGRTPGDFIRAYLEETFGSRAVLSPPEAQPFGFTVVSFGNARGGAGFAEYRVRDGRIQLWIAAVAAAEAGWALPVTGAVAFSINCGPTMAPRDRTMAVTSVSAQCLGGKCQDSDLAAAYLKTLQLGYVHDPRGRSYLINPRHDLWANGAKGPGYYHQVNGENEKLEPGRTNDAIAPSP